jgi:mediator of RNA polymerase II transcription subunit 6
MPPILPPPDEQEYDQPSTITTLPGQDLHAGNNLFWYFTSSPWFDPVECINIDVFNNLNLHDQTIAQQVLNDPTLWNQRLKDVPTGIQYVIAGEGQGEGHPWLLQRQHKAEVTDYDGNKKIGMYVEGNWYTHGTKVLMAPSLLDVVQSRLLTVATRMEQMAEISKNMTHWTPATGYSYFPPSHEATKAATTASRIGSPTLAPTDPDVVGSQSQGAGPGATAQATDPLASTTEFSEALLMHSLNLTNAYGDEYMDENPLKGEPGAFVFEGTKTAVNARNKAQEQAAQATLAAPAAGLKIETQPPSVAPSAVGTPKAVGTPTALEAQGKKGIIAAAPKKKKDRRKSQGGLTSPTTPSVP